MVDAVRTMGKKALRRLDAAAAMLQAPRQGAGGWGMVIQVEAGETWHQAVLRTVRALPQADQDQLKALVDWVDDYELAAEPAPAARPSPVQVIPQDPDLLPVEQDFSVYDDEAVEMALMSIEHLRSSRPAT